MIAPSFVPGAAANHHNLVLWRWGPELPHRVIVYDPSGRLPRISLAGRRLGSDEPYRSAILTSA
ncbi:hypothetical protein CVO77_18420 [Sphingopyxis lindanitolerans]|uniref:Uncharacterized protein n=1 Tax=Sphingopyxis lindanitolerans TaxID=2054227 RepID=A0A2S8B3P5_9SPHN|nr:hypothetical protein CVO77_18420 [Sphingopyxis lindanitolerans]